MCVTTPMNPEATTLSDVTQTECNRGEASCSKSIAKGLSTASLSATRWPISGNPATQVMSIKVKNTATELKINVLPRATCEWLQEGRE